MFFSDEFIELVKKLFAIPGVKLIVPLAFASWAVEYFEDWLIWMLLWSKEGIHWVLHRFAVHLPFNAGSISFIHSLCLFLVASLPLLLVYKIERRQQIYDPWPYTYLVVLMIWLTVAILLTVHRP